MQQRMFRKAAIALAVTSLAACQDKPAGLNLTPPIPPPGATVMYIINGATDSPNLSVALTDSAGANAGGTSTDLAFGGVLRTSTHVSAASGDATLTVDELLPSDLASAGNTTQALTSSATTINSYDVTAQIVTGTNAAAQVMTVTANGGSEGYGLGQADIVFADAAPASAAAFPGGIAYYFTDSDATHLLVPPTGTTFGVTIDPFLISGAAGLVFTDTTYRLFVVDGTNPNNVLFDSGASTLLQPPSGGPMVLALIDNPGYSAAIGNSPFMLFNSMTGKVTADTLNLGSSAHVVNGTNVGALDGSFSNVSPAASFTNLAAGAQTAACGFASTDDSVVDFWSTGTINIHGAFLSTDFGTFANSNVLVLPSGDSAALFPMADTLKTRVFASDARTVANAARIRFVNLATATVTSNPPTGGVLLYVNPTGTVTDATIQAGSATPADVDSTGAAVPIGYAADPNSSKPFADAQTTAQAYYEVSGTTNYDIRVAQVNPDGVTQTIVTEQTNVPIAAGESITATLIDGVSPTLITVDNSVNNCP